MSDIPNKQFKVICTIRVNDSDLDGEYCNNSVTQIKTLSETKAYRMYYNERRKLIDIYNSTLSAKQIYMRVELFENGYLTECFGTKYQPKYNNYKLENIV